MFHQIHQELEFHYILHKIQIENFFYSIIEEIVSRISILGKLVIKNVIKIVLN